MQYEEIKELIRLFEDTDLTELEVKMDDASVRMSRGAGTTTVAEIPVAVPVAATAAQPSGEPAVAAQEEKVPVSSSEEGTLVTAPIVGTFYASSAPDKPPYVKVGDTIAEGDTLCIIEAMKFMNEVPCEKGGTITEILVQDGDFVEFGQPLFRIV